MTSKKLSEQKPKLTTAAVRERLISERLSFSLSDHSLREVARQTGYHYETVRRYLSGSSKVPADFLAQSCRHFKRVDANTILGTKAPRNEHGLRYISTQQLFVELGRRLELVEDNTISRILLVDDLERDNSIHNGV